MNRMPSIVFGLVALAVVPASAAAAPTISPPFPGFAACKSPKAYRLKPGKYRFEVRAVLKGVADSSPASRSFKVVHVPRHRHR
jgi:hypothetical protein